MAVNFGELSAKHFFGDINFGEFEKFIMLFNIKQVILTEETLAELW